MSEEIVFKFSSSLTEKYYGKNPTSTSNNINTNTNANTATTVSPLHQLLLKGEAGLVRHLIKTANYTSEDLEKLPGPSLLILAIHLYLHPQDFGHDTRIEVGNGKPSPVSYLCPEQSQIYLALIKDLLELGIKYYLPGGTGALLEMCLEMAWQFQSYLVNEPQLPEIQASGQAAPPVQERLLALFKLLSEKGFNLAFKQVVNLPGGQFFPKVQSYLVQNYSATVIQSLWRGYRSRKSIR